MLLKDKNSVITGCNRGIGKEIVRVFAENGSNIWACVRNEDANFTDYINDLEKKNSVKINPVYFDLSDENQINAGVQTIKESKKGVDILVNNAGLIYTAIFQMTSMEKMKEIFEINYFSQMLLTQYISRLMIRKRTGSIVNISSSAAIEGNEGRTGYASAKSSMIASTRVLARELAPYNIRVNAVAPGLTQTEMMVSSTPEDALQETLNRICMKRVGQPEEIANSVLFLASNLSSYMTSQVLRVDGGM